MIKNGIIVCTALLLLSAGCGNKITLEGVPGCITKKINAIAKEDVWNPPAKVYRYRYKGEVVYYFSSKCCDMLSELYDKDCNLICAPDGGFTGKGDGKCVDFSETATGEELIWEDRR